MKKILLNLAFLGLFLPVISNAQTTSEVDAAKLEAKKKAEEEKAALPKSWIKNKSWGEKLKLITL